MFIITDTHVREFHGTYGRQSRKTKGVDLSVVAVVAADASDSARSSVPVLVTSRKRVAPF